MYGRDIVAPPRKQAANRENKHRPVALVTDVFEGPNGPQPNGLGK